MPESIWTIIFSSAVGAIVSYCGAVIKNTLDTKARINDELFERRTDNYKVLWSKTRLLPRWPRNPEVTYENLHELSGDLRDWYFDDGGIYLSRPSQKLYASLQEVIAGVIESKEIGKKFISQNVSDENNEYDQIRKACSALRTSMTDDLLSRADAPNLGFISNIFNWKKK